MPKIVKKDLYLDSIDEIDEQNDFTDERPMGYLVPLRRPVSLKRPAILKHQGMVDVEQAEKDVEAAMEEWDSLEIPHSGNLVVQLQTEPITCDEVLNYFRLKDMDQHMKNIKPVRQRKGFEALKYWIAGPPRLNNTLVHERDLFFAIAMCPFDSSDSVHMRVLQTLYKALSGSNHDCPRYGKHWEEIGFQGIDPGTDLRGVGFLGLFHLLYLALNPATIELSHEISRISKTEKQNFPFCTMGINMSRIVLETMREEVLNRECNRKLDVFQVTNDFYAGIFLRLHVIWCEENKTVMDSGYVIKDLTAFAKKHSSVILRDFYNYANSKIVQCKKSEVIVEFSNINNLSQVAKV